MPQDNQIVGIVGCDEADLFPAVLGIGQVFPENSIRRRRLAIFCLGDFPSSVEWLLSCSSFHRVVLTSSG